MRLVWLLGRDPGQREVDLLAVRVGVGRAGPRASRTGPRRSRASRAPSRRPWSSTTCWRVSPGSAARRAAAAEHAASATSATTRSAPRRRRGIAVRSHTDRVGSGQATRRYGDAMVQELLVGGRTRAAARRCRLHAFASPAPAASSPRSRGPGIADVDAAVSTALAAFESGVWSSVSATDRGRVLARGRGAAAGAVGDVRGRRGPQRGEADRRRPLGGRGRGRDVRVLRRRGQQALRRSRSRCRMRASTSMLREPVGVCALIVPWNFPLLITCWKTAPALACGNPVIIKPASLTPVTALMLGELLVEAGVPEGCVSVLPGPGGVIGDALVGDPRVNKVSFTGETTTGASILKKSADNITRVSLELGGKSACVVFADADWEKAVDDTAMAVFGNAGQDCCARSRIVVAAVDLRRLRRRVRAADRAGQGRDAARRGDRDGADDLPGPAPGVARLPRDRRRRRRGAGDRRRDPDRRPVRRRLVPHARGARGRRQLDARRPRGDLRPGRVGHPVHATRPTRSASRTRATTGCPGRCGPATSAGRSASARRSAPACCR